jgi:hypothetical protein
MPGVGQELFCQYLTVLTPEDAKALGYLPPEAIVGIVGKPSGDPESFNASTSERLSADEFRHNRVFLDFLHHVIRTFGPADPGLVQSAEQQGQGSVILVDPRSTAPLEQDPPAEDVMGVFGVEGGKVGEYHPNPNYLAYSANGMMQLSVFLAEAHIRELKKLNPKRD